MLHYNFELRITHIIDETSDTKSFVLEETSAKTIPYKPGQFLTFLFDKRDEPARRSYSISSNPKLQEPLKVTVKRIDNGEYSRYLFDSCKEGDLLYSIGASGFFTLPEEINAKQIFFFAAGSGITPILPLIKNVLHFYPAIKVFLNYSNRSASTTIFLNEIELLEKQFPDRFVVNFLFSSSKDLIKARLSKLILAQYLQLHSFESIKTSLFYLCGPHDYMQMISITLLTEGVPQEHIRKEIFDTFKPIVKELPPDTHSHSVSVSYQNTNYKYSVQYPITILEGAKRKGITLPYSCEAGKCGTCAATCVKGKVWMSYNEVLLDKELAEGRVLTCVGYPIGDDVEIVFPAQES